MSLKAAEVYKFKLNKKSNYNSVITNGRMFWHSKTMGTYVRGMAEGQTFLKKINPFRKSEQV